MISSAEVIELAKGHEDERRLIEECNLPVAGQVAQIQRFTIGSAKVALGNHYHANKDEIFIFEKGGGTVLTQKVEIRDGTPVGVGEIEEKTVRSGLIVIIPRMTAHLFFLDPETRMYCLPSETHDPDDLRPFPLN